MLTVVRFLLFGSWRVMNRVLPSTRMPLEIIWGARNLSIKIEVPTLILCVCPIGMSWFKKEVPFQNLTPLVELRQFASPRWCSYRSIIWGGMAKEATQALISFCFGEFFPKLLTFREAMVIAFLFTNNLFQGDSIADQSLLQSCLSDATFAQIHLRIL